MIADQLAGSICGLGRPLVVVWDNGSPRVVANSLFRNILETELAVSLAVLARAR